MKVEFVSRSHSYHPRALPVEDNGGGRDSRARTGRLDLEPDIDEHAGKELVRLVWNIDLGQQGPRAWIDGTSRARYLCRYRFHESPADRNLDG